DITLINRYRLGRNTPQISTPPTGLTYSSAPQIQAALANDTGSSGTNNDSITSDPTIAGQLGHANALAAFRAGFDAPPASNFFDVSSDVQSGGSFTLSPDRLAQVNGGPLAQGPHVLHVQATDPQSNVSAFFDVHLTLDTLPPTIVISQPSPNQTVAQNV